MFGIDLKEVALAAVFVGFVFGSLFLPPFYGELLQYLVLATAVFMIVRWLLRRRRSDNEE